LILIVSNVAHESANDLAGLFPTGAASVITASDLNQSFRAAVSVWEVRRGE
jgi:ABC-type cobalamin transport system ATPase subunit